MILYHGLAQADLERVLREGLRTDLTHHGEPTQYSETYLTPSPDYAAGFGDVVLEIELRSELASRLVQIPNSLEYRADFNIPPKLIKRVLSGETIRRQSKHWGRSNKSYYWVE